MIGLNRGQLTMNPQEPAAQLSPKQRAALTALVSGSSLTDAASQAGVHRSTVHLWTREHPIFRAALIEVRAQQAQWVKEGLQALATAALETLASLMTDPQTPPRRPAPRGNADH